jgi:hypothetical protein
MSQSTSTATSSEGGTASTPTEANNSGNNSQDLESLPTTLETAISKIAELKTKRDTLLADKARTDKEVENGLKSIQ